MTVKRMDNIGIVVESLDTGIAFIREKQVAFPVATMCRVLGVSTSGYYDWLKAPDSLRAKQDAALAAKIAQTHERSRGRYGNTRVHAELRAEGVRVGRKRVARIMR
ncbi:MAG TPA: IS3 family transposase, partial [Polyangiales bacterium]|nr:IS3 family transposase [Polyangiales bacterium]